ncbi:diaminopimelate epimerase [Evansella vedderi]|uniref:Diaminopimelate epimerase n=1 Tax=Evansella vedderi TaxID=38282 RepID=A0ABU0A2E5_9BACI|nr:diaminopimelate epimerase [Evansella vedderi]MDQ0257647.1 diaminopimelate epimerase [Evansella vedderi]
MKFTKMHGLGNQYIFVNQFEEKLLEEELRELAIEVSDIFTGIGSDGLILIGPSETADLQMRVFNKDGSEAKNCGNGLRCVAKYAYDNALVSSKEMTIETLGGIVQATVTVNDTTNTVELVTVDMGVPRLKAEEIPLLNSSKSPAIQEKIQVDEGEWSMTAVSMGNPHAVIYVDDINEAPLTTVGPVIEKHARFPEGVNVEFVEQISKTEMHFRVWERGSGVTQACGTGACAAVVSSVLNGFSEKGEEVLVHLAGGDLYITWDKDDRVWMKGPCETICEGVYYKKSERK